MSTEHLTRAWISGNKGNKRGKGPCPMSLLPIVCYVNLKLGACTRSSKSVPAILSIILSSDVKTGLQHSEIFLFPWIHAVLTPYSYSSDCSHVIYLHSSKHKLHVFILGFSHRIVTLVGKGHGQAQLRPPETGIFPYGEKSSSFRTEPQRDESKAARSCSHAAWVCLFFLHHSHHFWHCRSTSWTQPQRKALKRHYSQLLTGHSHEGKEQHMVKARGHSSPKTTGQQPSLSIHDTRRAPAPLPLLWCQQPLHFRKTWGHHLTFWGFSRSLCPPDRGAHIIHCHM